MSYKRIAIFLIAVVLLVVAIFSLSDDLMTPYVPVKKAKSNAGKLVQIIGKLDPAKPLRHADKKFFFSIIDDNNSKIDIEYNGVKPQNFERADQIVAIGKYNAERNVFVSDKLLVKCPSKYEEKYEERVKK